MTRRKPVGTEDVVYSQTADGRGNLVGVSSQVYLGKRLVHIKQWWFPPGDTEPHITGIGFALDEERFREVMAGLRAAEEALGW